MLHLLKNKNVLIFILAIFIAACVAFYTNNLEKSFVIIIALCGTALTFLALFFNLKRYYLFLIAVIPLSINTGIVGGAQLNFPSEGLLLLILPVLFVFNREYKTTVLRLVKHPLTILLVADLMLQFFTSITGTHIDVSLKRVLMRFIFIAGFYVITSQLFNKRELIKPWVLYSVGLLPVIYFTFRNHIHHSFNPRVVFSICQPYFNDHTIYGACLAFIIPILIILVVKNKVFKFSYRSRWALFILAFLVIISEILALSRAAILSLIVAYLFSVLLRYKVAFKSILIGLGLSLVVVFSLWNSIYDSIEQNEAVSNDGEIVNHFSSVTNLKSDASNLERINRWICAVRMFEERPLLGYGPGTYQFEYNQFQTLSNKTYISTNMGDRGNAHSEYLTYLSETGIFGVIIFILTVFSSIYYGMQNHYRLIDPVLKQINLGILLGLITFYFHGVFNSFLDQSKMAFLYFSALSTIVWINQNLPIIIKEKS